jgi:hypothetical protein
MHRTLVSRLAVVVVGAAVVAGCGSKASTVQPAPLSAAASDTSASPVAKGTIGVYTSTELGSAESLSELQQVKDAGFDEVIAYGSMNGRSIADISHYLDTAQSMGVGVVFSLKDILGVTDTDDANAAHHRGLFGQSTDAQTTMIVRTFLGHPAIRSVLIADEQPSGPSDLSQWLPRLKKRYDEIHAVKPVTVVMYWNPGSPEFYESVKQYADNLQVDYYPVPENSTYGPVSEISTIGSTLKQTAGAGGCFVLQAFGWNPEAHPEGVALGFTQASPAPATAQMVDMAKRAVEDGAANLAFYAMGDPGAASIQSMKDAVVQIRQASWWK